MNLFSSRKNPTQEQASIPTGIPSVLPFTSRDATVHTLVGGKGANLAKLTQAGFSVPAGFCITTAIYERVSRDAFLDELLNELAHTPPEDTATQERLAVALRTKLLSSSIPEEVVEALRAAYEQMGTDIAVAVRSSATAEDLPSASFAGQQDTYLNLVGFEAVLTAIQQCWASLWNVRAVSYRARNGIDHTSVSLAVVVQRMVNAKVAGVLFTANPLTGSRRQVVIDASPGLGEAVVSGAVNPDHFVVDAFSEEVIERTLGEKQCKVEAVAGGGTRHISLPENRSSACLSHEQIALLARLGTQVQTYYGAPQDIEWAIDEVDRIWLTQARPITTLFPLPKEAAEAEDLQVYFCFNVLQGVYRPFTPMGFAALRLMASSIGRCVGFPPRDALQGPSAVVEAGGRLFLNMTPILRNKFGRTLLKRLMKRLEARSAQLLHQQSDDPRVAPDYEVSRATVVRRVLSFVVRTRVDFYIGQLLFVPERAKARVLRLNTELRAKSQVRSGASARERLDAVQQLLLQYTASTICHSLFTAMPAFVLTVLAGKLLGDLVTDQERQVVLRALPNNPTTEMDLALWALVDTVRHHAVQQFLALSPEQLAQCYQNEAFPEAVQKGIADFLRSYGHRSVAEIDLGLPRWSEDPTHIMGVLTNYLRLDTPGLAPDVQFERGVREAEAMLGECVRRASSQSWLRGRLVHFCLRRGRMLAGMREMAKYYLVLLLAGARKLLLPVGEELVETGRLTSRDDIFFLDLVEAREALAGRDMRVRVAQRRRTYERELNRRHVPRVLLSDGTEPEVARRAVEGGDQTLLEGIPASAGVVTAKARVVLNPVGAALEPGEILIAPSTDPGWTPLFLTAGGMVMEMGGPMSHGAVVAREYGIPSVVGVPAATAHIKTGQLITVDGSSGTVVIVEEAATGENC